MGDSKKKNFNEPMVLLENITKSFGNFKALDNLCIKIKKGQIYGLIGPNGAGKTTTINILLGLLAPDTKLKVKPRVQIMGKSVFKDFSKISSKIGYMPQDLALYDDLTVEQNIRFFAELYGLSKNEFNERLEHILDLVEMSEFRDRLIRQCSGGMKRRTSLATALVHDPDLLILDEPTVGVDPELRIEFWKYFRNLADNGKTILITTHYLTESKMCDIVGLIKQKIIIEGSPKKLRTEVMEKENLDELPDMEHVFVYFTKHLDELRNKQLNSNQATVSTLGGTI